MFRVSATSVVVGVSALALVLGACSDNEPKRDDTGAIQEAQDDADVFALDVGDCLKDVELADQIESVPVVPCSEEHDDEIYAEFDMDDGDFPGEPALESASDEFCTAEFDGFVGIAYDSSELDYWYFMPTSESWSGGDRNIQCLIFDPAGPVTGSLADAQR